MEGRGGVGQPSKARVGGTNAHPTPAGPLISLCFLLNRAPLSPTPHPGAYGWGGPYYGNLSRSCQHPGRDTLTSVN